MFSIAPGIIQSQSGEGLAEVSVFKYRAYVVIGFPPGLLGVYKQRTYVIVTP